MTSERPPIYVDLTASIDLSVEDVWPDGDAPEVITPEAVKNAMEAQGSKLSVLQDWEMLHGLEVTISITGLPTVEAWSR